MAKDRPTILFERLTSFEEKKQEIIDLVIAHSKTSFPHLKQTEKEYKNELEVIYQKILEL